MQPSADAAAAGEPVVASGETAAGAGERAAGPRATVPQPRSAPDHGATLGPVDATEALGPDPADRSPAAVTEAVESADPDQPGTAEVTGTPGPAAPVAAGSAGAALTERERKILAFEQSWWRHAGAKEQTIRDSFGLSATRYYQLLNALIDNPAALAAEPLLVGRLRRLRASRARARRR